jgi:hypothetical protein
MPMNLQLSLKTKWFEMTKAGIKTEDYRELNSYWFGRLCLFDGDIMNFKFWDKHDKEDLLFVSAKPFEVNIMTLGYPSKNDTSQIIKFKHGGIEIRQGNPEWGAEPDKYYFVIKHGERIK